MRKLGSPAQCCCDCGQLCVWAYSLSDWCDEYPTGPDCDAYDFAIPDASVEIYEIETIGGVAGDLVLTGTTDADGKICFDMPHEGLFRIWVIPPDDCNKFWQDIMFTCDSLVHDIGFGFCCWQLDIQVTSADDASPLGASVNCPDWPDVARACTDEDGTSPATSTVFDGKIVGVCEAVVPCPAPEDAPLDCELVAGVDDPVEVCTASADGFIDRCFEMPPTPCGYPSITTTKLLTLYGDEFWVKNPCCGCEVTEEGTRPREVLPKTLTLRFLGPEGITGSNTEQTFTLTYNEAESDESVLVWDTGCLSNVGGWGLCAAPYFYSCLVTTAPYEPCEAFLIGSDYIEKFYFPSTKITLEVFTGGEPCEGRVTWQNYWDSGCTVPANTAGPDCGWPEPPGPEAARPVAKLCILGAECDCGFTEIGDVPDTVEPAGNAANYYPTDQLVINDVVEMCGTPVDALGTTSLEGYFDCFGPVELGAYAIIEE